jgi:uncharacterized protein (DUF362 family)
VENKKITRREFVITGFVGTLGIATGYQSSDASAVVSVVKIKDDNIGYAVEKAIDLLGGINEVTKNKTRIMLKPNLVGPDPRFTTNPEVIKALALLMKSAGKDVSIGEGSAAAPGFNITDQGSLYTRNPAILDPMQSYIFEQLGYTQLAESLNVPLINLHSGDMVEIAVPGGHIFEKITVHKSLADIDMLCSVPMMKTHVLATVTLGMKNLIGLYPGSVYCSVRSCLHNTASEKKSPGIAYEILDMVKACTPGLVVIDGSMAMEGDGPTEGSLVKTNIIIAGTNPLATDMVAAHIMGFETAEIPQFKVAIDSGMRPSSVGEIEIRGEKLGNVQQAFIKPHIIPWTDINSWYGVTEI